MSGPSQHQQGGDLSQQQISPLIGAPVLISNPFYTPPIVSGLPPPPTPQLPIRIQPTPLMNVPNIFNVFPSPVSSTVSDTVEFRDDDDMIKKVNVGKLEVGFFVSSEKAFMTWQSPVTRQPVKFLITYTRHNGFPVVTETDNPTPLKSFTMDTVPGVTYKVHIRCFSLDSQFLVAEWSKEFRAVMDPIEFGRLHGNCVRFSSNAHSLNQMQKFDVIYRCKPQQYWDQIYHYSNDIMQKYTKDNSGQPGNLINGRIKGLFFSANTRGGRLPRKSYFGDRRMICQAHHFLNPSMHNMYFGDFYCNNTAHYVTIVVCVRDSQTDKYCQEKLIMLNPMTNPFIKVIAPVGRSGKFQFFLNTKLFVEIFYTEDIPLHMGVFTHVEPDGPGSSRYYGVPNNKMCTACNLYPVQPRNQQPQNLVLRR